MAISYPLTPFTMKTYICPDCGIEQNDVLVETGYLLRNQQDGWYQHRCPGCGAQLDDQFLEENGILPQ